MGDILSEVRRWRAKADEARTMGELMSNAVARDSILEIAERYERFADHMEWLAARKQGREAVRKTHLEHAVMRTSLAPITPQDLRNDARNTARLAEIAREGRSKATLSALSRKFLDEAEQLETALGGGSASRPAEAATKMPPDLGTPAYWRDRGAEARAMLDRLTTPEARPALEVVIENYDRLLKIAEAKEERGSRKRGRTGTE